MTAQNPMPQHYLRALFFPHKILKEATLWPPNYLAIIAKWCKHLYQSLMQFMRKVKKLFGFK